MENMSLASSSIPSTLKVANMMRNTLMELKEGELLGSEESLIAQYQVSRPTFREAVSTIVQEQLLTAKRGAGGGFFARSPDTSGVSRMAAVYLKYHKAKLEEMVGAFIPVRIEVARLAALSKNSTLRQELADFYQQEKDCVDINDDAFILGERRFLELLGKLCGNKVLELFLAIVLDLSSIMNRSKFVYGSHPERIAAMRRKRNRLIRAILDGDSERALILAQRCAELFTYWLMTTMEAEDEIEGPTSFAAG